MSTQTSVLQAKTKEASHDGVPSRSKGKAPSSLEAHDPAGVLLPSDISLIPVHPSSAAASPALRSSGDPLGSSTLRQMEPHFGNLGGVRVHTGPDAAASAQAIGAAAYTVGKNIVFNAGRFQQGAHDTHKLLAHELVHVAQQSAAAPVATPRVAERNDPLERNAVSVLAEGATLQRAPHTMVQRQGLNDPLPPVSLYRPRERPSIMSQQLGFHLTPSDRDAIRDFLAVGHFAVGPHIEPMYLGRPTTLDDLTDQARGVVLPIIPREEVKNAILGRWLILLMQTTEIPGPDPFQFTIPPEGGADEGAGQGGAAAGGNTPAILSDWNAAVGGQWAFHLNSRDAASSTVQVQFTHGSGAVQEVFQFSVDMNTHAVQSMGGVQLQATRSGRVLGVAIQGAAFLQLMAGLTQSPGQASGAITLQVQAGLQVTATFSNRIQLALQVGPSLTLQDQQRPAVDFNVAPQAGGPDTFGPITTPQGGQFAGLTLRF